MIIRKSSPFCRRSRRGATLIEVMAGLVVLGVLVTSVIVARARLVRQWAEADRRLASARALDSLVAGWLDGPVDSIPINSAGELGNGRRWRTVLVNDREARKLGAAVVRVEVLEGRRAVLTLDLLKQVPEVKQ